jgi:hypothetical protein
MNILLLRVCFGLSSGCVLLLFLVRAIYAEHFTLQFLPEYNFDDFEKIKR